MHSLIRRAWVEIDLGALLRNAKKIQAHGQVPLLPMVKADAYGLGAVAVARALDEMDPWGFGVATVVEGEDLRRAGIERPIIVFTPLLLEDLDAVLRANLIPTLGDRPSIEYWLEMSGNKPWQLAVDTGMSRAGVQWDELDALRDLLGENAPQGVFTHFHSAEMKDGTRELQEHRFDEFLKRMPIRPSMIHAENSPALEHHAPSRWSVARPGMFLYGVSSGNDALIVPEPVVAMRARVVELRTIANGEAVSYDATYRAKGERRIATLPIGYADGYRRALGNHAQALVRGTRVPVVGVVTMDMLMLDVTEVSCEIGDTATLIGADGKERIEVREVAAWGAMSPYEVLTALRGRLPRRYLGLE